jgi:hypothetical protein
MSLTRQDRKMTLFALTWPILKYCCLWLSYYSDHALAEVGVSNQIKSYIYLS